MIDPREYRELGMNRRITRRNFLNGVAVGLAGVSLGSRAEMKGDATPKETTPDYHRVVRRLSHSLEPQNSPLALRIGSTSYSGPGPRPRGPDFDVPPAKRSTESAGHDPVLSNAPVQVRIRQAEETCERGNQENAVDGMGG